jgi:hypothetical protein
MTAVFGDISEGLTKQQLPAEIAVIIGLIVTLKGTFHAP